MPAAAPRSGNQQLELERLLQLAEGHDLAEASEERIARGLDRVGQAEFVGHGGGGLDPTLAEGDDLLRRADADVFAHPEGLQPVEMARGLAAEAVAGDVEAVAALRHRPARGGDRVDGIAGGRRQHEIGGLETFGPVATREMTVGIAADLGFRAFQAGDAAQEIRKALEVAVALEMGAAHHRREAEHLRALVAAGRDEGGERLDHRLVGAGAGIDAQRVHRLEHRVEQGIERIGRGRGGRRVHHGHVHGGKLSGRGRGWRVQALSEAATGDIRVAVARLATIRSLWIMIGAERMSRSARPMLKAPSWR